MSERVPHFAKHIVSNWEHVFASRETHSGNHAHTIENSLPFAFLWDSSSFSLVFMFFLSEIPEHRKSKFLHYEIQCYEVRKSRPAEMQIASPNGRPNQFLQNSR